MYGCRKCDWDACEACYTKSLQITATMEDSDSLSQAPSSTTAPNTGGGGAGGANAALQALGIPPGVDIIGSMLAGMGIPPEGRAAFMQQMAQQSGLDPNDSNAMAALENAMQEKVAQELVQQQQQGGLPGLPRGGGMPGGCPQQ